MRTLPPRTTSAMIARSLPLVGCSRGEEKTALEELRPHPRRLRPIHDGRRTGAGYFDPESTCAAGNKREVSLQIDTLAINLIDDSESWRNEGPRAIRSSATFSTDGSSGFESGFYQLIDGKIEDEIRPIADSGNRQVLREQPPAIVREYICRPGGKCRLSGML